MLYYVLIFCLLRFVCETLSSKVYIINANNEKQSQRLIDQFKKLFIGPVRYDPRFEESKNKCNRHFGSIFGTKAQKLFCLGNYYENRKQIDALPFITQRKQTKLPNELYQDSKRGVMSKSPFSTDYIDWKDMDRMNEFSNDYLDVGDLVRYESRRTWPYETMLHKSKVRMKSDVSSSAEEDSEENNYNRFQIIDSQSTESDSSSETDSQSEEAKLMFTQGRNRHVKDYDGRKRLQHFLPKRFHWDRGDIQNLGYYWFNGPRGRFAEAVNLF